MRYRDHSGAFVMIGLVKPCKLLLDVIYCLVRVLQTLVEGHKKVTSVGFSSPLGIGGKLVQIVFRIVRNKTVISMDRAQKLCLGPPPSPSGLVLGLVHLRLYSPGNQKEQIP